MGEIQKRVAREIVDAVRDVCGQNINFISPSGIITASTDAGREGSFHEIGRRAAVTGTVIEVGKDGDFYGTQAGVNIPILHCGEVAGVVGISGDPDEVRKYAYLAEKIAVLLLRERDLNMQKNSRRERMNYMIRSLVGQGAVSQKHFQAFMKEYNLKPEQQFRTVLIRTAQGKEDIQTLEKEIYRAFGMTGSPFHTFSYPGEYILFIQEEKAGTGRSVMEKLAADGRGILRIGAGTAESLSGQHRSYRAAERALKSLKTGGFASYEEMDLELLLAGVPDEAQKMFLEKTVGMLAREDLRLLSVYFEEDCSLLKTSRRLNIHRNTLQYRLDRIFGICGYNPRTFRDGTVLYMGVMLAAADQKP